jgi:hypothetical protein
VIAEVFHPLEVGVPWGDPLDGGDPVGDTPGPVAALEAVDVAETGSIVPPRIALWRAGVVSDTVGLSHSEVRLGRRSMPRQYRGNTRQIACSSSSAARSPEDARRSGARPPAEAMLIGGPPAHI